MEGVTGISYIKKLDVLASSGVDSLGYCAVAILFQVSLAVYACIQVFAGNFGKLKICARLELK
jgi:hypothetical protein